MTLRELQTIILLYRACGDLEVRRRALHLLPDLGELVADIPLPPNRVQRWKLVAFADGQALGGKNVVCSEEDLPTHKAALAAAWDLAHNVTVEAAAL